MQPFDKEDIFGILFHSRLTECKRTLRQSFLEPKLWVCGWEVKSSEVNRNFLTTKFDVYMAYFVSMKNVNNLIQASNFDTMSF